MKTPWLLASLATCASLACSARPVTPSSPASARATRSGRGNDDFAALSWEDRHDQMTWVVLPNMAERFQAFAGTADATLTCRSCHGPDPETVAYRMPRSLPALDPAHLPAASDADQRGRTAKFMIETVTPAMADLLNEPSYDAKTQRGFGCFNCHPSVGLASRRSAP